MPNPRFLADNDFDERIRKGLLRREPSIEFRSAKDAGIVGRPDPEVLRISAESGLLLVSHDRKTMPAHFDRFIERQMSSGLDLVRQKMEIRDAIEELLMIWVCSDASEWVNRRSFVPF